ncbi:MAG: hypothetical protein KC583_13045, partial [Myxococcales bacterium]|nr:hypothetical protein [Myxococcales bacterium]
MPHKAWVLAPQCGRGAAADRDRLIECLACLHPTCRPGNAKAGPDGRSTCLVTQPNGRDVTDEDVVRAIGELSRFDGRRLFWLVTSVTQGPLPSQRFLKTDGLKSEISVDALWMALNDAAAARDKEPLVAIVDVCHAAPPKHLELHEQLVVVASSMEDELAFADDGGGWLTQRILDHLFDGATGTITVADLDAALAKRRDADDNGLQRPVVFPGRHKTLPLNL